MNFDLTKDEKAEEAFASVAEFWDKDLEYFETLTTAESEITMINSFWSTNKHLFLVKKKKEKKNSIRTRK